MKLTIGMASYNNYVEVWFTLQALRLYHDLTDVELLVIDNYGDDALKNEIAGWMGNVRYVRYTEKQGTAAAKNQVFVEGRGEWIMCIDSHVMLAPGTVARFKSWIDANRECRDLIQGPMFYDNFTTAADAFDDVWRGQMWGIWRNMANFNEQEPYEIPMMGMGLFTCRKDAWLGFNPEFRGFGGEEGYIHTKFRQAGQKTLCLPWLKWAHHFRQGTGQGVPPFIALLKDKIKNYLIGFRELGLDLAPVYEHFGADVVKEYDK